MDFCFRLFAGYFSAMQNNQNLALVFVLGMSDSTMLRRFLVWLNNKLKVLFFPLVAA
jgi:hypothetical protein